MKKLLLGITMLAIVSNLNAQDAAEKKVQAGLIVGYGMNFQKMGTKLIDNNGVGSDLTLGANINFSFSETIGLSTGVEFDFETLRFKAGNTPVYYDYADSKILTKQQVLDGTNSEIFQLQTRKQKPIYLTIPTMLIFRTNFIGYFRYFGKFGLRNSFLLSNKTIDEGFNYNLDVNPVAEVATAGTNENMVTDKSEVIFFKSAVGAAGGAEWNFVGSTTLMAEIGYYYGFINLFWKRADLDRTLYTTDATGIERTHFSNLAKQSQLMFKLSILF